MSTETVTIREGIHDALHTAGPAGLTMAAIAGAVQGPWRQRDVDAVVRKLWQVNELGRRVDGTFVLTMKVKDKPEGSEPTRAQRRSRQKLDAAVKRVAAGAQREGHSTKIRTRTVDPALLSSFCPVCRATVHPRLDGTCATCGTQTGANVEEPPRPRRRRRRKPLKNGQPGFGTVCPRCGAAKSKQAHTCQPCSMKRKRGRKLTLPAHDRRRQPRHLTEEQLLDARRLYATGLSLRDVAERIYPDTSYASVGAASTSLYSLFKTRGWKLRPQREVTRARSTKHGRKGRKQTREQQNAYRRWLSQQRGWKAIQGPGRPICTAVRQQPPGKGNPCKHHALTDSEYCWSHDPRYELNRQAQTARTRARISRAPMLPAAPFVAWLEMLHSELGGWRQVAATIGSQPSTVNKWGNALTTSNTPLERISVRVVRRSAENAGTTLEAIYRDHEDQLEEAIAS